MYNTFWGISMDKINNKCNFKPAIIDLFFGHLEAVEASCEHNILT